MLNRTPGPGPAVGPSPPCSSAAGQGWGLLAGLGAGEQASLLTQRLFLAGPRLVDSSARNRATENREQNHTRGRSRKVSKEEAGGRQRSVPLRHRAGCKRLTTEV